MKSARSSIRERISFNTWRGIFFYKFLKWINLFLCKTVDLLPWIFWQNTSCVWKACVSWLFNVNFIPFEMSSFQTEVCTCVPVWILEDTLCIYDEIPKQVRNDKHIIYLFCLRKIDAQGWKILSFQNISEKTHSFDLQNCGAT